MLARVGEHLTGEIARTNQLLLNSAAEFLSPALNLWPLRQVRWKNEALRYKPIVFPPAAHPILLKKWRRLYRPQQRVHKRLAPNNCYPQHPQKKTHPK